MGLLGKDLLVQACRFFDTAVPFPTPTPAPTATLAPTPTFVPTPTAVPTDTPNGSPAVKRSPTSAPTATHIPTATRVPTPTPTPEPTSWFFPQTGHNLSNGFKYFWLHNGGLSIYGYPISEELTEVNPDDGKTYVVQYFERGRLEYHPELQGTQYETELGLLGRTMLQQRGWVSQ